MPDLNERSPFSNGYESADVKRRWCGGRAFFVASLLTIFSVFLVFALIIPAWAVPTVTYHGRILRPTGEPLHGNVAFLIQVLAPEGSDCVLYEETQRPLSQTVSYLSRLEKGIEKTVFLIFLKFFKAGKP